MTADEIIAHALDALNLSSPEATLRIGRTLNVRYKRVTSAIGLITSRRAPLTKVATIGSSDFTFSGVEHLDIVYRKVGTRNYTLKEVTYDEVLAMLPRAEPPRHYAVKTVAAQTITITTDCVPTTAFTLYASGLAILPTLSGIASPAFPESYHDVLIHGILADEYRKLEKEPYAQAAERDYENRLSDLKMFLAKSAYLDNYAGKHGPLDGWWDEGNRA